MASHLKRFDHVGVTVADLEGATSFFVDLGLEVEGRGSVEGEFIDTGGGTGVDLATFTRPDHTPGSPNAMAYVRGPEGIVVSLAERIG